MMLVTTRSGKVSDIVRTTYRFLLEGLKDDVFWCFFKLCVFGSDSSNNNPELERIGEQILPKLEGSPLAAKTLGRLLGSSLDPAHWNVILNSHLWELPQKGTDILPALRLSYMYLPFHLKRCFSFCAVYSKVYNFVKEDLAEIWVAEGFVEPEHNIPLQTGCKYFEELESFILSETSWEIYSISNMKNLRCLKVLGSCYFKSIPAALCSLYNLELLCARKSRFAGVPGGFSNLINLQKFKSKYLGIDAAMGNGKGIRLLNNFNLITGVLSIHNLCEISKDEAAEIELMKDYISSLHLVWSKQTWDKLGPPKHNEIEVFEALHPPTNIKSVHLYCYPGEYLPSWFRGSDPTVLSSLTEISFENCRRLSSLELFLDPAYMPAIKKMRVGSCVSLESVPIERFGNLHSLEALHVSKRPKMNSRRLLAPYLKTLHLHDSGSFGDDIDCISLTTFILSSSHRASFTFIRESEPISTSASHGSVEEKFPLLTFLAIRSCFQLETLRHGSFSCLENLAIESCPRLKWQSEMVLPSSLQELTLTDCGDLSAWFPRCLEKFTSLKSLKMDKCKHIEYIPRGLWISNLKSLQELKITNCEDLVSIGASEGIAHIPKVWIENCTKLEEVQQPLRRGYSW
ncbi:unnamed protein product [Miscanthus lutarioriparius]|uniref:R13L1/DRL21-like LRR repeat region domain-containing protein n=1 Tax=Miscanthus lutarioriparius TaxID=422564 RepID=A0A811Q815_9POAL|nr:unnamed protein product [Miscanthus lutarioriparius]